MNRAQKGSENALRARRWKLWPIVAVLGTLVAAVATWQFHAPGLNPLAQRPGSIAGVIDIAVLVFREGLECVLVLAALTAGMKRGPTSQKNPVALGVAAGLVATAATWTIAITLVNDLSQNISALALQAATGLLAVVVLLVVMNWFFHKVYWTGWISLHTERRRELAARAQQESASSLGVFLGTVLLGFTSVYREGFEVVLFLQSYRLRLGNISVYWGAAAGVALTAAVALLTFVLHRKLPYRRMLVFTGVLLGIVLMIMVGEQVQEMQLAGWIPTTIVPVLANRIPGWMSLWFSAFPSVETLTGQAVAASLVIGSYFVAGRPGAKSKEEEAILPLDAYPAHAARVKR